MTRRFVELGLPAEVCAEPAAVALSLVFTEGPAVDADGAVYFSDIVNNRILRPARRMVRWRCFGSRVIGRTGRRSTGRGGCCIAKGLSLGRAAGGE